MGRILRFLIWTFGATAALQALGQTPTPIPVTGNLTGILGNGQAYAGVSIQLLNCPSPISIPGYSVIVQTGYQVQANPSGVVNTTVWSNDLINCNGTQGNSEYQVSYVANGAAQGTPQCYQVVSTQTWNLNTQQPIACNGSAPNPFPGVTQIIPGTNCTVSPSTGKGIVVINCAGGSSSGIQTINSQTGPAYKILPGFGITVDNSVPNQATISLNSGFTINSFTGCGGALELGQTVTNPTCAATYSSTPVSATITNTDGIDSPLNLISPFSSGTIVGTFVHYATATTTVTLTAIGSSSQTATQTYTWNPRIFAGLGTAGATSTVTSSGTTAILSTSDVLPSAGLGAETVGETFGPYAPSAQAVYLLLTGGIHTFIDVCSGFPFAFNSPLTVTFVNQFGLTETMYLYQSTNPLTGSCFEPKIVS